MQAMKLSRYLDVLRQPGVARVALFATIGRLPFAIVPLSVLLLMREEGYHYGEVGAVVGAEGVAIGLTAALLGRLVDRVGRRRVILSTGALCSTALATQTVAILSGAPVVLLVVLMAIQGATIPPISPSMRALWADLVPEDALESAYAFDAIQLELVFVVGPLIAAGVATAAGPAVSMLACAGLYATAATGFATSPAARTPSRAEPAERRRGGAMRSPGMRTLVLVGAVTAVSFGALEVALTAFAEAEGSRGAVGPLVTLWALGSVVGGLWYGSRSWIAPAERRFLLLTAALAAGSATPVLAPSIAAMGALLVLTGLALAPLATVEYALVDRLAPAGTPTEAYSWMIVANVVGAGAGSVLAGLLVEEVSIDAALGAPAVACALGLALAVARRRTLEPA